jgi:hypothetical protein
MSASTSRCCNRHPTPRQSQPVWKTFAFCLNPITSCPTQYRQIALLNSVVMRLRAVTRRFAGLITVANYTTVTQIPIASSSS